MNRLAFISYQTEDRHAAARVKAVLADVGIESFMAHEDIHVSEEWRLKILSELVRSDIFVCILSKNYLGSHWCIQESGIAAYRPNTTIIPLSIDGTIPVGFLGHVQSTKIEPSSFGLEALIPGIVRSDFGLGIEAIIARLRSAGSFRRAEACFQLIIPYLERLSEAQAVSLMEAAAENGEVYHADLCVRQYIPKVLDMYGHLASEGTRKHLEDALERYR